MKPEASNEKKGNAAATCYCTENVYVCQIHPAPFPLADNPQGKQALLLLSADEVIPLVPTDRSEAGVPGALPHPCSPARGVILHFPLKVARLITKRKKREGKRWQLCHFCFLGNGLWIFLEEVKRLGDLKGKVSWGPYTDCVLCYPFAGQGHSAFILTQHYNALY